MRKQVFIFLVLALMIFGFGCTTTTKVTGATNGLEVSFVSDEPPESVFDNNLGPTIRITLNLKNKGDYTIPKGKVVASLSGIPQNAWGISSMNVISTRSIEGLQEEDGGETGAEEELTFGDARYKEDLKVDFKTDIIADACYYYETDAAVSLCLKENPLEKEEDEEACDITSSLTAENSISPIQISNVNQRGVGEDEVRVSFDVEEKGSGDVYENDAFTSSCSGQNDKKNKLKVKVFATEQDLSIECSTLEDKSEGVVKLVDAKKTVNCIIKTSGLQEGAFKTPLQINLAYFIREKLSKAITVENSGE